MTRQTVWKAIDSSYPKMEKVIARALGVHPSVIWPERYPETKATAQRLGEHGMEAMR